MPYFLLVIGTLLGAYALYHFFLNASSRQVRSLIFTAITGVVALALFLLAISGRLPAAIAIVAALWPFLIAWLRGKEQKKSAATDGPMTRALALEILGLKDDATAEEIKDAHIKLMKKVHPDQEGSEWLAKRINAAKDFLLKP